MPVYYAVGNSHLDLAWLWPLHETYRKTARTFAAQLRHIEEYPEYKFIQSQPASYEMCKKYYKEIWQIIKKIINKIIKNNNLTERHARALLKLPNEDMQIKVLKKVTKNTLHRWLNGLKQVISIPDLLQTKMMKNF